MTGYCLKYNQEFDLDDAHVVHHSNADLAWCPICLAHGERALHVVMETWRPAFEQNTKPAVAATTTGL